MESLELSRSRPASFAAEATGVGEPSPWGAIWAVGGLCWLVVTGTALLWLLPESGMQMNGKYFVTNTARLFQHVLVFLVVVVSYRIAVTWGWPGSVWARTRVVSANLVLALGVCAFAPVALALAAGFIDGHVVEMRATLHDWKPLWPQFWAMPLRLFLPPYVLGLCAIGLVLVARRHHRDALRAAELTSAYTAARLAMLSAQLQPHFLFNSLHAISVLVDECPRQARTMVARLGDFLHYALESHHWPWVALSTELNGLGAYLAVQQIRFSDLLTISMDTSPESLSVYLPSLLLQPLVENAIEHGRNEGGQALHVTVTTCLVADRLCIVVNNSSPQLRRDLSRAEFGTGLQNVDLRLRAAYATEARLTIGPDRQGGTSAFLDLPLRSGARPGFPLPARL